MATRFYLPSTGAADVAVTADAGWNLINPAAAIKCVTTRIASAMANIQKIRDNLLVQNVMCAQYISAPIAAQAISGTVKGQILAAQTIATSTDARAQISLRVVSGDGITVRGTLLAPDTGVLSNEFSTASFSNRKFPLAWTGAGTAITEVAAQEGDRIVIELGYRMFNTTADTRAGSLKLGDDSATDLPENETETTAFNPWIEFSHTMFDPPPVVGVAGSLMLLGVGK